MTAFVLAAIDGKMDTLKLLDEKGANWEKKDM